ncbi:Uncharacterised protein [Mycobacteroides abscessus]|nr:Uncharacterised protein [Mycobacteroides abscessus]CQA12585.1 Uncharacterised protein [Mycobacteroides abscessus]
MKSYVNPLRWVNRSSTVMSRGARNVSSSGPSGSLSTRMSLNSGSQVVIGSLRRIVPSSTRFMVAALMMGFVMEAMRKIVFSAIESPASISR